MILHARLAWDRVCFLDATVYKEELKCRLKGQRSSQSKALCGTAGQAAVGPPPQPCYTACWLGSAGCGKAGEAVASSGLQTGPWRAGDRPFTLAWPADP